jgi:hypothetical protein
MVDSSIQNLYLSGLNLYIIDLSLLRLFNKVKHEQTVN